MRSRNCHVKLRCALTISGTTSPELDILFYPYRKAMYRKKTIPLDTPNLNNKKCSAVELTHMTTLNGRCRLKGPPEPAQGSSEELM
jgi:hypothetical protein